jgi:uncharacterized repeat protein (TIGR03803 family)
VVVDRDGEIFGATEAGGKQNCPGIFGSKGCGTIYRLARAAKGWRKTTLYSFSGNSDGANPAEGLSLDGRGDLYGNATCGGQSRCKGLPSGVVFALYRGVRDVWTESVLYTFGTHRDDGFGPIGGLVSDAYGNLYGTTLLGGPKGYGGPGTVFALKPPGVPGGRWHEAILHAFTGAPKDGGTPEAGLAIDAAGNLYGTTYWGGDPFCPASDGDGCGVVFEVTPSLGGGRGTERILHTFEGVPDGSFPQAPLAFDALGHLFGTSQFGGDPKCDLGYGCGTVFRLVPRRDGWHETVVHAFKVHARGGEGPASGITFDPLGNLYGTTMYGGRDKSTGFGTVFELLGPLADR